VLGTQCVTALLLLGVPVGRVAGQTAAEATCRSLLDSSTAKVIVLPLPVDGPVPEVPPPAATEAMCDQLALHCGLGWLRLGDCLVFAVPVPFDLPVFDFEEPLPGHVAPHRIEAWRLLRGRPYAAVTEAWLSLANGATRRSLLDHDLLHHGTAQRQEAGHVTSWLDLWTHAGDHGEWSLRARQWPWYLSYMVEEAAAKSCGVVGDVPPIDRSVTLDVCTPALGDLLSLLSPDAGMELLCDGSLVGMRLAVGAKDAPVDDVLASIAFSLAAVWRHIGDCLYLGDAKAAVDAAAATPESRRSGNTAVLLPVGPNSDAALAAAAGPASFPLLEIRWTAGETTGRTLVISYDPSRGLVRAIPPMPGPEGERSLHCAVEAVAGLAESQGMPLTADALQRLIDRVGTGSPVDGNALIGLGADVGLSLVGARGTLSEVSAVPDACIVHLAFGHYACVSGLGRSFSLVHGATGRRGRFPTAFVEQGFSGHLFVDSAVAERLK